MNKTRRLSGRSCEFGRHRGRWVLSDEYSESNGLHLNYIEMEIGYSIPKGAGDVNVMVTKWDSYLCPGLNSIKQALKGFY